MVGISGRTRVKKRMYLVSTSPPPYESTMARDAFARQSPTNKKSTVYYVAKKNKRQTTNCCSKTHQVASQQASPTTTGNERLVVWRKQGHRTRRSRPRRRTATVVMRCSCLLFAGLLGSITRLVAAGESASLRGGSGSGDDVLRGEDGHKSSAEISNVSWDARELVESEPSSPEGILILAQGRSGSTMLGELFRHNQVF